TTRTRPAPAPPSPGPEVVPTLPSSHACLPTVSPKHDACRAAAKVISFRINNFVGERMTDSLPERPHSGASARLHAARSVSTLIGYNALASRGTECLPPTTPLPYLDAGGWATSSWIRASSPATSSTRRSPARRP